MAYHTRFTKINPQTLKATVEFFDRKPFRGSDPIKLALYKIWLSQVSAIYGVKTPELVIDPDTFGSGNYNRITGRITLPKFSVVTLFHEFRHHLQANGAKFTHPEFDARGWSLSLYHLAKPKMFERAVKNGGVLFITNKDIEG